MIEKKCKGCGKIISVRLADHNRGWGNHCSKSCKASEQTRRTGIAGPHYKAEGKTVQQMASGNFAKSKIRKSSNTTPWASAGVSKETYLYYADEYGGTPIFNSRGEYDGLIPTPFDNTQHQNNE